MAGSCESSQDQQAAGSTVSLAALLLAFELTSLRSRQWRRGDHVSANRGRPLRLVGCACLSFENMDTSPDGCQLNGQRVAFAAGFFEFGAGLLVGTFNPAELSLLPVHLTTGTADFVSELLLDGAGLIESLAELTDHVPGFGELVAVVEGLGDGNGFSFATLSRSIGADPVAIGAPLSGPAALAGDRHRQPL